VSASGSVPMRQEVSVGGVVDGRRGLDPARDANRPAFISTSRIVEQRWRRLEVAKSDRELVYANCDTLLVDNKES